MSDPPKPRRPTPLGVGIPPRKPGDSLPPDERAFQLLKGLSDKHDALTAELASERGRDLAWRAELSDRLDEHEARIRACEDSTRATQNLHTDVRGMREDVRELTSAVLRNQQDDVATQRDLGQLKAETARIGASSGEAAGKLAGIDAGRAAATKWGGLIALVIGALWQLASLVYDAIKGAR